MSNVTESPKAQYEENKQVFDEQPCFKEAVNSFLGWSYTDTFNQAAQK